MQTMTRSNGMEPFHTSQARFRRKIPKLITHRNKAGSVIAGLGQPEWYAFSPASMRSGSRFSAGGRGQVAYGEKTQGGL